MKKSVLSLALALVFGATAVANNPIDGDKKEIKTSESTVSWKAYKVTGASHEGNVNLSKGSLDFKDGKLSGGEFVVDMTSLVSTDMEGGGKGKLEGHLKSDDFFGVNSHPTSTLVFTSVKANDKNSYNVTGELTIKGITKSISFNMTITEGKAKATLKVDRTKFNIKYGSSSFFDNLKDKAINDEFDLVVELAF